VSTPFHGIVSGAAKAPVGQITLPVTFRTQENFRTKYMQFEVADFKMAYNAFLERPALTKFMAIYHYAYLVLKMSGPNGVISIKGDVKCAYDYDWESYETADMLLAIVELQELKKSLADSHSDPIMPKAKTPCYWHELHIDPNTKPIKHPFVILPKIKKM
jgi:hypothetical protein